MKILVTGAGGQLGRDVVAVLEGRVPLGGTGHDWWGGPPAASRHDVVGTTRADLAVEERASVLAAVEGIRPHVIIHTAAFTGVDACEAEADRALAVNALGTRHLAEGAERYGAHLVYVSTDYVFEGTKDSPYDEWDEPRPLSVYGRSKLAGERECPPGSTVVRTSWVCSVEGPSMLQTVLKLARVLGELRFVDDQRGSPTFTADLAVALAALATDRRPGVHHVTNQGATTWFGFARAVVEASGGDPGRVRPIATDDLDPPRPASRPANSVLDNAVLRLGKLPLLPDWQEALARALAAGERRDADGPGAGEPGPGATGEGGGL